MKTSLPPPVEIAKGYSLKNCLVVLYVYARDLYDEVESMAKTCDDEAQLLAFARACLLRAIQRDKN